MNGHGRGLPWLRVSVWYTSEPDMFNKFKSHGFQIAAGVPFMINEPPGNFTFRIGLFGLDKLQRKETTIKTLEATLDRILAGEKPMEAGDTHTHTHTRARASARPEVGRGGEGRA